MNVFATRCSMCKSRCHEAAEDIIKNPSCHVLVEANKFTRKLSKNEVDEKIRAWGNAAPPLHLTPPRYAINLVALEEAKILTKGAVVLTEDLDPIPIQGREEEGISDDETFSDESV